MRPARRDGRAASTWGAASTRRVRAAPARARGGCARLHDRALRETAASASCLLIYFIPLTISLTEPLPFANRTIMTRARAGTYARRHASVFLRGPWCDHRVVLLAGRRARASARARAAAHRDQRQSRARGRS